MSFLAKLLGKTQTIPSESKDPSLRIPCRADLWCRKRTSLSNMLDPDLFERYMTGDDRIDEDWIIQSNPPCAFKAEFQEACDTLLSLLQEDPGMHATKGWLVFTPPANVKGAHRDAYLPKLQLIVRTAEREMKLSS